MVFGTIDLLFALAASAGVGAFLWVIARKVRTAPKGTFLAGDGAASALSLLLVACLVIVMAWSIKGGMEIFSEPVWGATIGLIASLVAVFIPLKLFGSLPD